MASWMELWWGARGLSEYPCSAIGYQLGGLNECSDDSYAFGECTC